MFTDEGFNRQEVFLKGIQFIFTITLCLLHFVLIIKAVTNVTVKHLNMV